MDKYLDKDFWENLYQHISEWLIANVPAILLTIVLFLVAVRLFNYAVGRVKQYIISKNQRNERAGTASAAEQEKRINTLTNIFKQGGMIVIWLIFIMMLLSSFNVHIGPILASAGILGLAIGFGSQELVRDFISGFFILLENQIRAGDVAVINGTGGLVENIALRTTTLRDVSGTVHVFQNGKINTLSNMTKEWSAIVLDMGVAYKEDTDTVIKVMKEVGEEMREDAEYKPKMIEPMEVFGLDSFGDSAIIIKARIKTTPGNQWAIGREYRRRLKIAFDAKNIEIPFPHLSVYWGEEVNPLRVNMEEMNKGNKLNG